MTTRPPAEVGMTLEEVDTPALLIELDAFEANLRALADTLAGTSVKLRPHGKAHKCPVIGHKQMALGAVGLCCQKVSEAEAMVFGGLSDIYVTNEIVGARKLARLAPLAHQARIATCIDNPLSVAPSARRPRRPGSRSGSWSTSTSAITPLRRRAGRRGGALGPGHRQGQGTVVSEGCRPTTANRSISAPTRNAAPPSRAPAKPSRRPSGR